MLRPSPNHGTQRLPNDDDDDSLLFKYLCDIQYVASKIDFSFFLNTYITHCKFPAVCSHTWY